LTATTGLIDAVCYLGLGHVFVANMTGNVVLLGFGIAQAGGLPVVAPIVSVAGFLVGAGVGGRIGAQLAQSYARYFVVALGIETALVGAAALVIAATTVRVGSALAYAIIALLAVAMGLRNAIVRRMGVPDLTTTVLTLTLTGLAADSPPAGGVGTHWHRRLAAVAAMLAGALVGALLEKQGLAIPLALAAGIPAATLLGFVAAGRARSHDPRRRGV
jgi:uncharacterized membrane protein YoaK (UPF0700 family)